LRHTHLPPLSRVCLVACRSFRLYTSSYVFTCEYVHGTPVAVEVCLVACRSFRVDMLSMSMSKRFFGATVAVEVCLVVCCNIFVCTCCRPCLRVNVYMHFPSLSRVCLVACLRFRLYMSSYVFTWKCVHAPSVAVEVCLSSTSLVVSICACYTSLNVCVGHRISL
jgi:hypothetical protein